MHNAQGTKLQKLPHILLEHALSSHNLLDTGTANWNLIFFLKEYTSQVRN